MRYIVLIYNDSGEGQSIDRFQDAFPRSLAPACALASARPPSSWPSGGASGLDTFFSKARRPLVRWFAAPILGVPSVYGGYNTMLNFWHGIGVSPSVWLHILAIAAGVASGLAVIARLRT
jgi:hypothetical protein